jgi:hypothetical protein
MSRDLEPRRIARRQARKARRKAGRTFRIAEKQYDEYTECWSWPTNTPWERTRRSERGT